MMSIVYVEIQCWTVGRAVNIPGESPRLLNKLMLKALGAIIDAVSKRVTFSKPLWEAKFDITS